jgi:thiol:disulfide interchange protein DsbD
LAFLGLIANAATSGDERSDFLNVSDEGALDAAIASASKQGRMMLIDFSAEWCAECKVMERTVLSQAVVRRQLHGMMLIRADLTHFDQSSKKLMKRFAVVGPPTMIFLNPDGTEIYEARVVGGIGIDGFLTRIAKAIRA